ncbi:adhesin [Tetzosporium hominis]|uniref:Adhesin n=1 Tax=Tetzosporium hominis TaxID=2020506 RepID=A0A264W0R9_9BACL|nr:zinc ABC transporter substrate-binding protein [Tetzosporium hominis]OZS77154.1 adhesin [Tetzosporium hominis]
MKKILFPLALVSALTLAACSSEEGTSNESQSQNASSGEPLSIYTTVYPLEYFTERIGGDLVTVQSVYPPGADEHTFEPSQQDMIKFAEADKLFAIGLGLESFIPSAKETLANQNVEIVELADFISDDSLLEEEHAEEGHSEEEHAEETDSHAGHDHGALDPHLWISPTLSAELSKSILNELIEASPENEEEFTANFEALEADLADLDESFKTMVSEADRDTFFVSHAAFGYWVKDYGLQQIAVAGLSTQDEPSQKELAAIVDQAKEQNISYILTEQNVSSKLTDIIRTEVGAETLPLHNLGVLTDEDIDNGDDYLTLMERNIETLKTALND